MMNKSKLLLLSVFLLILALFISAQEATYGGDVVPCFADADCQAIFGDTAVCSGESSTCHLSKEAEEAEATTEVIADETEIVEESAATQKDLEALAAKVTAVESKLIAIESNQAVLQQQVNQIGANLQAINSDQQEIKKQLSQGINAVSTGLAGLQQGLNVTNEDLNVVEEKLTKEQKRTRFIIVILSIVFLAIIATVIFYFYNKKMKVHPQVVDYITKHIQAGKKFPHIKENLIKAGWDEEEIKNAYKGTLKKNYKTYSQQKGEKQQHQKIILIFGFGLIIVLGLLFVLKAKTTGQAYYSYGGVQDYEESIAIDTTPKCFFPKIMKDGVCCMDVNSNGICDETEGFIAEGAGVSCQINADCSHERSCIGGRCLFVREIYDTSDCIVKCNILRIKLTTKNQDYPGSVSENYILPRGGGSYTGAGALEWQIMKGPDYCQIPTKDVPLPIKLIKKDGSKVLSEEIIVLAPGQTSEKITHPTVNLHGFTIRVDEIFHSCGTAVTQ